MNNRFIKVHPLNGTFTINYVEVNNMMKSLNRGIETREEYFEWVRDWKKNHENLVAAIQGLRDEKQRVKYNVGDSATASVIHQIKLRLRPFARELYNMRKERKDLFKSGAFAQVTEAA